MAIDRLFIIGAGGHAKVVLDALALATRPAEIVTVIDDNLERVGSQIIGHVIEASPQPAALKGHGFHLAMGQAETRTRLYEALTEAGAKAVTVQHPAATTATSATIAPGCFLAAHAAIAPDARIGLSVIVNHGAVVDHDCIVGDFSHIAPHVTLGGGVQIAARVLVGAGATILPGVKVGAGAIIAAGATIVRDVAAGERVIFALTRKR